MINVKTVPLFLLQAGDYGQVDIWRPVIGAGLAIAPALAGAVMALGFILMMLGSANAELAIMGKRLVGQSLAGLMTCFLALALYYTLVDCLGPVCN